MSAHGKNIFFFGQNRFLKFYGSEWSDMGKLHSFEALHEGNVTLKF
jgi:hypothetical protein